MRILLLFVSICVFSACGVKGDPLPPLNPPHIGRGKPDLAPLGAELTDKTEEEKALKKKKKKEKE